MFQKLLRNAPEAMEKNDQHDLWTEIRKLFFFQTTILVHAVVTRGKYSFLNYIKKDVFFVAFFLFYMVIHIFKKNFIYTITTSTSSHAYWKKSLFLLWNTSNLLSYNIFFCYFLAKNILPCLATNGLGIGIRTNFSQIINIGDMIDYR